MARKGDNKLFNGVPNEDLDFFHNHEWLIFPSQGVDEALTK